MHINRDSSKLLWSLRACLSFVFVNKSRAKPNRSPESQKHTHIVLSPLLHKVQLKQLSVQSTYYEYTPKNLLPVRVWARRQITSVWWRKIFLPPRFVRNPFPSAGSHSALSWELPPRETVDSGWVRAGSEPAPNLTQMLLLLLGSPWSPLDFEQY